MFVLTNKFPFLKYFQSFARLTLVYTGVLPSCYDVPEMPTLLFRADAEPMLFMEDGGPDLDQLTGVVPNCRDDMRVFKTGWTNIDKSLLHIQVQT